MAALVGGRRRGRHWATVLLLVVLVGATAPADAWAQSDSADAPVFAVALGSSLADMGAATLLVAAGEADAVLMVDAPDMVGPAAAETVRRHGASAFVLVGGPAAVGPEIETELAALAPRATVSRVWGADREATAAAVARQVLAVCPDPRGAVLALANGWSAADAAAAAAAVAAGTVDAVLWSSTDALGDAAAGVLKDFSVRRALVVGGPTALNEQVADAAHTAAGTGTQIRRVGGADRTDTAVKVARVATAGRASAAVIADGWDLPAVAQAAALAAASPDAVVLFSGPGGALGDTTVGLLADSMPEQIWVTGSNQTTLESLASGARQAAPAAQVAEINSSAAATTAAIEASRQQDTTPGGCVGGDSGSSAGRAQPPPPTTQARVPIPPNPTGINATPLGPNAVHVTWDLYPTGHSVIELTVAWYLPVYPPQARLGSAVVGLSDTGYTVTGLDPGVEYEFVVFARNSYGERRGTAINATTPKS